MKSKKWVAFFLFILPVIVTAQKKSIGGFDCGYAASVRNVEFDSLSGSFKLIPTSLGSFALYMDVLSCHINNTKSRVSGVLIYPPLKNVENNKPVKVLVLLTKGENDGLFKVIDTLAVSHLNEKVHLNFITQNNLYIVIYSKGFKSTVIETRGFEYIK